MYFTGKFPVVVLVLLCLGGVTGCSPANPGPDRAVVQDHWGEDTGGWDYTLIDVDDRPFPRERIPFGADMRPGALLGAGEHRFKVSVMPYRRRPTDVPRSVLFEGMLKGGRRYFVGTKDGVPVLIPERAKR